jgi:hypothetical protein
MREGLQRATKRGAVSAWRRIAVLLTALGVTGAGACSGYDPEQTHEDENIAQLEQPLGSSMSLSFQNGALPSSAYAGNTDATIKQANPTTNYGNATTLEADGDDGGGVDKSVLLQWSVSAIPAGSVVQSASITLRVTNATNNVYNLYEVRRSWNESQVTWNNAVSGAPWATAGAQGSTDRGAVVGTVTGAVGTRTITLNSAGIALVQSWVNGGTNAGVIIASTTNPDGIDFASSENGTVANRPKLNVTFQPPDSAQSALDFDGVDDRVTMGPAPSLGLSRFTLEAWFKRTGTGASASSGSGGLTAIPLVTKGRGESDGGTMDCNYFLGLRATDSVLAADFEDMATGANHPVAGATPVTSGVWHHAAVSFDGTTWRLYLDGQLDATRAVSATPRFDSIQHFGIGTALNTTGAAAGFFDGVIDEVRVWNYARSLSEIQAGMSAPIASATGLVGRWGFDEGSGAVAANSAGVAHGTISGATFVTPGAPYEFAAPPQPALVAPSDGATNVARPPSLSARVSDPDSAAHDIRFFGRPRATAEDFTVVVLPDTQYYSETYPSIFSAQTQWIMDNRDSLNIEYVAHVGDIVNVASQIYQWNNANAALSLLETPATGFPDGMPYCPSVGNHDIQSGSTTNYNNYFGVSRFQGRNYYGGHYGSNNDNHYNLFSAGGMDFIVISFAYDSTPDQPVLDWADSLLKAYPNRRAIVASHYIVGTGNPASFGTQGQAIYDNLKDNPNLFLLVCGHICGEGRRSDVYQGRTVYSILTDYQCRSNGGNGWLRTMTFSPANDTITFKTYSPTLNQWETDADSQFTLPYDMPGTTASFVQVGAVSGVPVGNTASVTWNNLSPGSSYEWYADASDGQSTVSTATRTFTTAP